MTKNPPAPFEQLIHVLRGKRVMLDADLARIYGVPTKHLNQQVKRNARRFPSDFMFRLTPKEAESLGSRATPAKQRRGGRRWGVLAFTQEGVSMLSCVLRSPRAVAANVAIMRAFVRYREALALNRELDLKLRDLEQRVDRHDTAIVGLLDAIRGLVVAPPAPRRRIGFTPRSSRPAGS